MTQEVQRVQRATLSRAACIGLLGATDIARVVISVRCLPAALPARISLPDDRRLLLASAEEPVIVAAQRGEVLSVQIDGLEPDGTTWSVMASGIARPASETASLPHPLVQAISRGARLIEVPLSVVAGERVG